MSSDFSILGSKSSQSIQRIAWNNYTVNWTYYTVQRPNHLLMIKNSLSFNKFTLAGYVGRDATSKLEAPSWKFQDAERNL